MLFRSLFWGALTVSFGRQKSRLMYRSALHQYPQIIQDIENRHFNYNHTLTSARKLEEDGSALIIAPSSHLDITTYTRDPAILQKLYDIGVTDYANIRTKVSNFLL